MFATAYTPPICIHSTMPAGSRRFGDVEPAIGIEQRRILPIQLQPFLVTEEHGNARAVFARIENLLGLVLRQIDRHLALPDRRALSRLQIQAVNTRRNGEAVEPVEHFLVVEPRARPAAVPMPGIAMSCAVLPSKLTSLATECASFM